MLSIRSFPGSYAHYHFLPKEKEVLFYILSFLKTSTISQVKHSSPTLESNEFLQKDWILEWVLEEGPVGIHYIMKQLPVSGKAHAPCGITNTALFAHLNHLLDETWEKWNGLFPVFGKPLYCVGFFDMIYRDPRNTRWLPV